MSSILTISKNGTLKRADNSLVFIKKETNDKIKIPINKISQLEIYSNVILDSEVLYFLNINNIGINFYQHYSQSKFGEYNMWNKRGSEKVMINQFKAYLNNRNKYIYEFYKGIINNILFLLAKYQTRPIIGKQITCIISEIKNNLKELENGISFESYLLFEAKIWKKFYESIDLINTKDDFVFEKRSRRPPLNYMNALISFLNTKLYFLTNSLIKQTKLDNRIGFVHELTDEGRFSLALDISELFKPFFVFYFIFYNINKNVITISDFEKKDFRLTDIGLNKINKLFQQFIETSFFYPDLKRNISYQYLIKIESYKLIKSFYNIKEFKAINFNELDFNVKK